MSDEEMIKEEAEQTAGEAEEAAEEAADNPEEEKDAKIRELSAEVAELTEKVAILKNEYAKAYADTENTRKRLQKEYETRSKYHIQSFALEVLPVLDNCERALAHETADEAYRKGVEMIYAQLKNALAKEGVEEIEALNKPFDANWHQALMSEPKENMEPGIVTEVLQKGYKLKDRLLRAAMVKISE